MQETDEYLQAYFDNCKKGERSEFHIRHDGILCYKCDYLCSNNMELKEKIFKEAHQSRYFVHPGHTKMYHKFRGHYWWSGIKVDITSSVFKCLPC